MPHILIVEDDFPIRQVLAELLEEEGFRTASTADGKEALGYLELRNSMRRNLPQLIMLDMRMPKMNGRAFLSELARLGLASIPVIVMTGHADDVHDLAVQPAAVLQKPLPPPDELLDLVRNLALGSGVGEDFKDRPATQPYGSKTDEVDTLRGRPAPRADTPPSTAVDTQKVRTRPPKK